MNGISINQYLEQLISQPVGTIGRASNMLWLGIGEEIRVLDRKGSGIKKNTFMLHVQSAWRIVNKEDHEIRLASSDFYSPSEKTSFEKEFDWEPIGNSLFDEKSQDWLKTVNGIYIKEYKINRWGDLLLIFSNGERLEIFVISSDNTESWRILKAGDEEPHLVATGLGVDFE